MLLFLTALFVGRAIRAEEDVLHIRWPPLYAYWDPHVGPGTVAAPLVALLVVAYGPVLARRLSWRGVLLAGWVGSLLWTWSLALIDGWQRGVAERLTTKYEYLQSVPDVHDIGHTVRTFTDHILLNSPDNWPPHVAGHPPGALLTFVGLDRIGLAGGGWAAVWCVTLASSAAVAVLLTVRALGDSGSDGTAEDGSDGARKGGSADGLGGGELLARRAAPFVVLAPAAVWFGVSADAYFMGVGAWGVALLALAATRRARAPRAAAVGAGLLFGLVLYLSYGLVLLGLVCLAVLAAARTARPVPYVLLGMLPWVIAFTAAGFWWFDGYTTLVERYYQGSARFRPYGYFVWANLAANVAVVGLATAAALRHAGGALPGAVRGLRRAPARGEAALVLLVAGAAAAVLAADLSGMSKAETERIWLPFTLWLLPAAALLPTRGHRWWLAVQAAVPLTLNHLLFTGW
nr:hypothetical protein [Streptomyces oceani]